MSGRGKGGKKAKTSGASDYKWTDNEPVVMFSVCEDDTSPVMSALVPCRHLLKILDTWLTKCIAANDDGEAPSCDIDLSGESGNDCLADYLTMKDLRDDDDDDDDDEDDDSEDENEDADDAEIEDMSEVLEPIDSWISTNIPDWSKNMPPRSYPVRVVARFNVFGTPKSE